MSQVSLSWASLHQSQSCALCNLVSSNYLLLHQMSLILAVVGRYITYPVGNEMPNPAFICNLSSGSLFAICFLLVSMRPIHSSHATSLKTILTRLWGNLTRLVESMHVASPADQLLLHV